MTLIILNSLPPLHWALAGLGIAGVTLALLLHRQSASRYFDRLRRRLQSRAAAAVFPRSGSRRPDARGVCHCCAGLVLGGFLSAVLGGGWKPTWALGMFDRRSAWAGGQARVDVRRRTVHRLRHAARRRLHERSRHLRPRESRASEPGHHHHASWPPVSSTTQIVYRVIFPLTGL